MQVHLVDTRNNRIALRIPRIGKERDVPDIRCHTLMRLSIGNHESVAKPSLKACKAWEDYFKEVAKKRK